MRVEPVKIVMIETRFGSEDGVTLNKYEAGLTYHVGPDLASNFIGARWARRVEDEPKVEPEPVPTEREAKVVVPEVQSPKTLEEPIKPHRKVRRTRK